MKKEEKERKYEEKAESMKRKEREKEKKIEWRRKDNGEQLKLGIKSSHEKSVCLFG